MSQKDDVESRSTRSRAPSRKKYENILVDTTFTFNEITKDIQKHIKGIDISGRGTEDLETAIDGLQQVKARYTKVIEQLNELFLQDKWGESKEVKTTVETVSSKYLELVGSKIQEISSRLELSHRQHKQSRNTKAPSRQSSRTVRTRVSKATSSAECQRAYAEAAAAQKQAEYDILIAKKEKERKELDAAEERKRVEAKAQYDHEIAVLKARMKAATAEAKLNAIEHFMDEKESEVGSDRSAEDEMMVDKECKSEAQSLETRYYTKEWIVSQQSNPRRPSRDHNSIFSRDKVSSGAREAQPPAEGGPAGGDLARINKELTQSLARIGLPKCHPDVFNGDVTMFHPWKSSFKGMIYDCHLSPEQEMNYLSIYTADEPLKLVKSFRRRHTLDNKKLLKDLWNELETRFGNVATITNELLKRLRQTAKFEDQDRKKLQAFSDLCADIESQMAELPGLSCLNYPNVLQPMFRNLPASICSKWEERVVEYATRNNDEYPAFTEFATFIKKRALLKNHPNIIAREPSDKRKVKDFGDHVKSYKGNADVGKDEDSAAKHCPFHDSDGHILLECKAFSHKTLQERIDWMKRAGLCFLCSAKGHISKECKQEVKCTKCGSSRHQTILHRERKTPVDGEEITSKQTNINGTVVGGPSCSKIVLLDVFHPDNAQNAVRTYAVIDEQSNASMIAPALLEKLGISGKKEKYYLSTCSGSRETKFGRRASRLLVKNLDGCEFKLPTLVECDNIPSDKREIPIPEKIKKFAHLKDIAEKIPPMDDRAEILLLIGRDAPKLMKIRAFRNGPKGTPWAHRLALGWTIIGQICLNRHGGPVHITAQRTVTREPIEMEDPRSPKQLTKVNDKPTVIHTGHELLPCPNKFVVKEAYNDIETTVTDVFHLTEHDNESSLSVEDRYFEEIMKDGIHKNDKGNWEMPLPLRSKNTTFPCNKGQALSRLKNLLQTLKKKPKMSGHYFEFMGKLFTKGHAVPVKTSKDPESEKITKENGSVWYLPHFGVYHPQKPDKIRVVFDSSAECEGVSLNKELLSGPDMANNLLGILIRFRRYHIAVACDIEQMFHGFYVNEEHRDLLRFLWFEDNEPTKPIIDYHMTVHLFGNKSSPAVAMYGLQKTALEQEKNFGLQARTFVAEDFYVDDGLTSCPTLEEATELMLNTRAMLDTANLRVHKMASNSLALMSKIPSQDRADNVKNLDFQKDPVPVQRALGVSWNLLKDCLTFVINVPEKPFTRRGVLSIVNSIYDPLGLALPVTIRGRMLLRDLMKAVTTDNNTIIGWDDLFPDHLQDIWRTWQQSLKDLEEVLIPRCYIPNYFHDPIMIEIHAFSDASRVAIGAVVYLKTVDLNGNMNVRLVFAQAKLAPKKLTTIPRLELCAAVLATKAVRWIKRDLKLSISRVNYYTDSKVTLGYIQNESRRFFVYVANRVQIIRSMSEPTQWKYVDSASNPAVMITRGTTPRRILSSTWLNGPPFLMNDHISNEANLSFPLSEDDPEIRSSAVTVTSNRGCLGAERFTRFSRWSSLRRALATLILKVKNFKQKKFNRKVSNGDVSANEFKEAELLMIKTVQQQHFPMELSILEENSREEQTERQLNRLRRSSLYRLNPFVDKDGLLRVGGRLRHSEMKYEEKHPVILPKGSHLSKLAILHHHDRIHHQGRLITNGAVRQAGLWIVGVSRMVNQLLRKCVTCRRFRGKPMEQLMADLPSDRTETPAPFTNVGFDVFGPWLICTRRLRGGSAKSKRWGLVFTCLNSRAVHIEVLETMESDSFICALRRFFAIRGAPTILRCDQGTNFIGAKSELDQAMNELDDRSIGQYVATQNCQWLFNPPHASHFGGVWERQIGTIRRILDVMLGKLGPSQLTHELLVTLMAEISAIINSRPISALLIDSDHPQPLNPSMLLWMKSRPLLPPPGNFTSDQYSRKRWRKIQYLSDQFWTRWKREYLQLLQARTKWNVKRKNLEVGDIVIMKQDSRRYEWPLARVTDVHMSDDNKVRKANIQCWKDGARRSYLRPINELVFLTSTKEASSK